MSAAKTRAAVHGGWVATPIRVPGPCDRAHAAAMSCLRLVAARARAHKRSLLGRVALAPSLLLVLLLAGCGAGADPPVRLKRWDASAGLVGSLCLCATRRRPEDGPKRPNAESLDLRTGPDDPHEVPPDRPATGATAGLAFAGQVRNVLARPGPRQIVVEAPTGTELRQQREALGWTQQRLSEVAGIGVRTLREVEHDQRKSLRSTLAAITGALKRAAEQKRGAA